MVAIAYLDPDGEHDDAWRFLAQCDGAPLELFFPNRGESTRQAKTYCWGGNLKGRIIDPCPVRLECLDYALTTNQTHGIWGGMSSRERRSEKRSQRQRQPQTHWK